MQVIGLCRFSYPAIGGFQVEHTTIEERQRYLYAPRRLEERLRLFETVTLPSLKAQTDAAFEFVIVTGTCLPTEAVDRLRELTACVPQIRIVMREPGEHRSVVKAVLNEARLNWEHPCVQFRLDDDDAVAVDFVAGLRAAVRDCAGFANSRACFAIDFNQGYLADFLPGDVKTAQVYRNLVTAGLGMFVQGGNDLTIMNFAHQRIGRFMPVVAYADAPMWVRGLNDFNDSPKAVKDREKLEPITADQKAIFADRFGIRT